ncbi:MAG: phage major capsid domain-containing protein, partial [Candidatus Fonsibacter sp.]
LKGGQNITCQAYNAISQSITNHVYIVAVPSLETIINREVLWKSTVTLKISALARCVGYYVVNYGVTGALAPFPLHSLVNVMSATITNNIFRSMSKRLYHCFFVWLIQRSLPSTTA